MPRSESTTRRPIVRGVTALVALVALIIGVPLMLVRVVGRPWPQPFPSIEVVWRSVRSGNISDGTVLKALAVVMWIAWARLTISVAIEVVARLAHRHVPRVVGLGRAQHWAAALVASVILVVGVAPRPIAAAPWSSAAAPPRPITAALLDTYHRADPVAVHHVEPSGWRALDGAQEPEPHAAVHVVQRHESFWSIAEGSLGDGSRWREIVAMNAGRQVAPGVIFAGTAERLLPGWELIVPGSPTPGGAVLAGSEEHTVVVTPGDTLSGIAARELGEPSDWPKLWETNQGRQFGDRVFDDPDLILPGWELIVPEVMLAPPTPEPPVTSSTSPLPLPVPTPLSPIAEATVRPVDMHDDGHVVTTSVPPVSAVSTTPSDTDPLRAQQDSPRTVAAQAATSDGTTGVAGVGSAVLLAAGVAGAAEARRRRRLRAATMNARLATPTPRLADLDRLIRKLDAGDRIARLDIALRAVGHALFTTSPGTVVLGVIDTDEGTIDVLLDRSLLAASAPWTMITGHRWRLPASIGIVDLATAARQAQQPCPALIHVGSTPLDGGGYGQLYLDLEAIGVLAIDATPLASRAIVRAIVAGLAVSPLAESAHLITCGLGSDHLGHSLVEHPDSLSGALAAATRAVGATSALTAGLSTFVLRSRQSGGEAWEPAIVAAIGGADADPTVFDVCDDQLLTAAPGGQGIGVIVDRHVSGVTWVLGQGEHRWTVAPLGLEVVPVGLLAGELHDLQLLIEQAEVTVSEPPPDELTDVPAIVAAVPTATRQPALEWSLMVRVLGPAEVVDSGHQTADFERSKALELVVWMSQHREHSTRGAARTALWETTVRDATFANVVSDARRSLARLLEPPDGEEWIGRTLSEDLPLHAAVVTDADVLADSVQRAAAAAPADAIEILRGALGLVREMPFAGTAYLWPDAEGITSALILLVTAAATQLAELHLAAGDVAGVFWATGQGLKVLPGHEELISLRMRAHGRQGDLAGVRHEWEAYERVLDADTWSDGAAPSPKLVALRRELLAPSLSGA